MLGPFPALPIFLGKNPWERGCTGTYNLTNENTRDWVLLVSLCFDKLVTLSSTSKKGEVECFSLFFLLKILPCIFIFFLFGSFENLPKTHLNETLTHQTNSKQSDFRVKLKNAVQSN